MQKPYTKRPPLTRVHAHRLSLNLTQKRLARRARVSHRSIYVIERRLVRSRRDIQRRVLRALKIPFRRRLEYFDPDGRALLASQGLDS